MPIVAIATAAEGGDPHGGSLCARIFESLGEAERRAKYDDPLSRILTGEGIEHAIRGFSLPPDANHDVPSIGIEVRVPVPEAIASVAQAIADLGLPPTTVLDVETDKATVHLTLAEAEGG